MDKPDFSQFVSESDIAIIGIACRFPGAKDVDELWHSLQAGKDSISFFSDPELLASGVDPAWLSHPSYVKAQAVLPDIELFDASFFDFSPAEAEMIDPQQRLFLECAWQALESAGYDVESYGGAIAVYAGTSLNTYLLHNLIPSLDTSESAALYRLMLANGQDFLSTRVSYKLNLKGPSLNVQTACSTSLVATHLGCQSLLNGECDMALAGGVSIRVPHRAGYLYQEGMILSPNGQCRAFDAQAQGTVGGNGLGIVVLKRLAEAIADGDYIYATIKGSAINNDGAVKVGYTAPSVEGQAAVISEAQTVSGVAAETVTYIEAHGTGTHLGDPIEIAGLTAAFGQASEQKQFCAIGSIKTNIGHLDAAAGVAGLIKTALSLQHRQIPPSLHFDSPNPQIDFGHSPFYVNTRLAEWTANGMPLRAGVSSFGIGGTNAHVVLEEAPPREASGAARPWQVLLLSTKTETALDQATANLATHLQQNPELNLADVAYTLSRGRQAFSHRRLLVCQETSEAAIALASLNPRQVLSHAGSAAKRPVAFMFSGQGAQYVNMGLELYQQEPAFRSQIDLCSEILMPALGCDLRQLLYPAEAEAAEAAQHLNQTAIAQPALFVFEYALAQLWLSWGVRPQVMIGHSLGEYVAACLAGVFVLEDGLSLIAARGRLMQQLPAGAMLAVSLAAGEVEPLLNQELSLAVVNSPSRCVVSGSFRAIEQLQAQLAASGIDQRRLKTSHAFHSAMMEPAMADMVAAVQKIRLNPPQIPYVSNVTGSWITAAEATDSTYWAQHMRQTVRFADGIEQLLQNPQQILLEVGPGRTLSTLALRQPLRQRSQVVFTSVRHPQDAQSDLAFLFTTLGKLWLNGIAIDWSQFYSNERRQRLPLPTYPFERQRYWIAPTLQPASPSPSQPAAAKKPDIADWFYLPLWQQTVPPAVPAADQEVPPSVWLVFADSSGLAPPLVEQLGQLGQAVVTVRPGADFVQHNAHQYSLNPQRPEDYGQLLQTLLSQDELPQNVLHLWSFDAPAGSTDLMLERLAEIQDLGFYSLLYWAQAVGEQGITEPMQLTAISDRLWSVTGTEQLSPAQAMLLGPLRVIPKEYANLSCRSIDVVRPSAAAEKEQLVAQLLAELTNPLAPERVAYREQRCYVPIFQPVRLSSSEQPASRLQTGGVYLITGGLGGLGLVLAEYLAQTVQAKLILIGRSALPDRSEWPTWLAAHDRGDRISRKIAAVQALENWGAEVQVIGADVTCEAQMRAAIATAQAQFGRINGVIHAAGMPGGGLIQRKTRQAAAAILAAKVKGTLILDALLKNIKLDFWVLCSSLTALLGDFGQVDYCSANAFLDAFAHYRAAQTDTLILSVNWDAWQQVGMAIDTPSAAALQPWRASQLQLGISPPEGADVFNRLLSHTGPQVLVSAQELAGRAERENLQAVAAVAEIEQNQSLPQAAATVQSAHPRPALSTAYTPPRNQLEQTLAHIWQQLLGIDPVGIHDDFFELGGDSLLGTQLILRIRQAFQVELPLHSLFGEPTVAGIASSLEPMYSHRQATSVGLETAAADREEIEL